MALLGNHLDDVTLFEVGGLVEIPKAIEDAVVVVVIFDGEEHGSAIEPMAAGVTGRGGLALGGIGPGTALGVAAIGLAFLFGYGRGGRGRRIVGFPG